MTSQILFSFSSGNCLKFSDGTKPSPEPMFTDHQLGLKKNRASKTFVLFVLCTEAETGYFGGRQAVKGEESQYSLTEALCLFWVLPWGLHLSPVTNIHIIDRVLYCRMALLSPIIENWLWKWYRGIEKNTFQANFVFFFQVFSTHFVHLFYNMYEMYESIYVEIMIMSCMLRVKRRPFFVTEKVRRPKIIFWRSEKNIKCPGKFLIEIQKDVLKSVDGNM